MISSISRKNVLPKADKEEHFQILNKNALEARTEKCSQNVLQEHQDCTRECFFGDGCPNGD